VEAEEEEHGDEQDEVERGRDSDEDLRRNQYNIACLRCGSTC